MLTMFSMSVLGFVTFASQIWKVESLESAKKNKTGPYGHLGKLEIQQFEHYDDKHIFR